MRPVRPEAIRATAQHVGLDAAFVEKDLRLSELLAALAAAGMPDGFRLVLAGGTCLARAYGITARMSEDVDLKIVGGVDLSKSALRGSLRDVKEAVRAAIDGAGFVVADEQARGENRNVNFELTFEPLFSGDGTVMRPHILLETTHSPLRLATGSRSVRSFLATMEGAGPEVDAIDCVRLDEMAAEKIVALTRRVAGELEGTRPEAWDPALVRHIYDLHFLKDHVDASVVAAIAREVMARDAVQFRSWFPAYASDPHGWTRAALRGLGEDVRFRKEFERFQADMVYGQPIRYEDGIASVACLAERVLDRNAAAHP